MSDYAPRTLCALATALFYSVLFGVIGAGVGVLVGAALRAAWGLVMFFATGTIVSFIPKSDWLRVMAARLVGSSFFVAGAVAGSYDGWMMEWMLLTGPPTAEDPNVDHV